jgi:hypothetical protein
MIEFSFSCVASGAFGFPLVNDSILQQAIYQALGAHCGNEYTEPLELPLAVERGESQCAQPEVD